ncbi:MAG: hypothetical protein K2X93_04785 [Candidatus Obscuribacterales bacterium]|nr:hypothetical protein [Candidatus Obscuribacterales bacterium]
MTNREFDTKFQTDAEQNNPSTRGGARAEDRFRAEILSFSTLSQPSPTDSLFPNLIVTESDTNKSDTNKKDSSTPEKSAPRIALTLLDQRLRANAGADPGDMRLPSGEGSATLPTITIDGAPQSKPGDKTASLPPGTPGDVVVQVQPPGAPLSASFNSAAPARDGVSFHRAAPGPVNPAEPGRNAGPFNPAAPGRDAASFYPAEPGASTLVPSQRLNELVPSFMRTIRLNHNVKGDDTMAAFLFSNKEGRAGRLQELADVVRTTNDDNAARRYRETRFLSQVLAVAELSENIQQQKKTGQLDPRSEAAFNLELGKLAFMLRIDELPIGQPRRAGETPSIGGDAVSKAATEFLSTLIKQGWDTEVNAALAKVNNGWNAEVTALQKAFQTIVDDGASRGERRSALDQLELRPSALEDRNARGFMRELKPIACVIDANEERHPIVFRQSIEDLMALKKVENPLATEALRAVENLLGSTSPERLNKLTEQECKEISKLWQDNKQLRESISVFKTMALTQRLSTQSTTEQIDDFRKALNRVPDSSMKKEWYQWAETQAAIHGLKDPTRAVEALNNLSNMALADNPSAQQAVRLLAVGSDPKAEQAWRKANDSNSLLPMAQIDLSKFTSEQAEQLRVQAFESIRYRVLSQGPTDKDAELMAHISMSSNRPLREASQQLLNQLTGRDSKLDQRTAEKNFAALTRGYFRALTTADDGSPHRTLAMETYSQLNSIMEMEYPITKRLDNIVLEAGRLADSGNTSAARFLAFLSGAPGGSLDCSEHSAKTLAELSKSADNRRVVINALTDPVFGDTFLDKGHRLSALADVVLMSHSRAGNGALTNPDYTERVQHAFLKGFNGSNSLSTEALFKIAPYWTNEHVERLSKNITPATIQSIGRHVDKIPDALRTEFILGMLDTVENGDIDERTMENIGRGIRAFAPHLDQATILLLTAYSGTEGKDFLEQRLNTTASDKAICAVEVQKQLADCLLTTIESSKDRKVKAMALHAFATSDWGSFGRATDRTTGERIARIIKDNPKDWFIQSQLPKLVHDHPDFMKPDVNRGSWNTPEHQKSRLTAYWIGNGLNAETATQLMDRAIQNYGLDKVRTASENAALLRSLHPNILADMGLPEIGRNQSSNNIAEVLHLMSRGDADKSWIKPLLEPLESKVQTYRQQVSRQMRDEVALLNTRSQDTVLKSIEMNAVIGATFKAKAKDAVGDNGLDKFRSKENALFDQLKDTDGTRRRGVEKVSKLLEAQRNLDLALANRDFVHLMNNGNVADADRLAKKTFEANSIFTLSLAPDMQRELVSSGEGIYKGSFGRVKQSNAGLLESIPLAHQPGTEAGYRESMRALREFNVSDSDSKDPLKQMDADLFRKQTLLGIQMNPERRVLSDRFEDSQKKIRAFCSLMSLAGTNADKMETFIEHMKTLKDEIREGMKATPAERAKLKELETDLLDMLDPTKKGKYVEDAKTRELLKEELKYVTCMRGLFDPNGFPPPNPTRQEELTKQREKLRDELERLCDSSPNATYAKKVPPNWYSTISAVEKNVGWEWDNQKNNEGLLQVYWVNREIKTLGAELAKVNAELMPLEGRTQMYQLYSLFDKLGERKFNEISDFNKWAREEAMPMLAAFAAGTAVFLSCSNPLTAVVVAPIAAITAGELTKEIQLNLGLRSDGSVLGDYALRNKPVIMPSGRERPMEFGKDVLLPYSAEYLQSAAMGAGGAALGSVAGSGLAKAFHTMKGVTRSQSTALISFVRSAEQAATASAESPIAAKVLKDALSITTEQSAFFTLATTTGEIYKDHQREKTQKLVQEHDKVFSFFKDAGLIAFLHAGKASFKGYQPMPIGFKLAQRPGEVTRGDQPVIRIEFDAQTQKTAEAYKLAATKGGSTIIEQRNKEGGFLEITDKGTHVWFEPKPAELRINRPTVPTVAPPNTLEISKEGVKTADGNQVLWNKTVAQSVGPSRGALDSAPKANYEAVKNVQEALAKLNEPVTRKRAELKKLETEYQVKEKELLEIIDRIPEDEAHEAEFVKYNQKAKELKSDYQRTTEPLKKEADALEKEIKQSEQYNLLNTALAMANGVLPAGEYVFRVEGRPVRLLIGQEPVTRNDTIQGRPVGDGVPVHRVFEILNALEAAKSKPDVLSINNQPSLADISGSLGMYENSKTKISVIEMNTAATDRPLRIVYNHETGHLFDFGPFSDKGSAGAKKEIDDAYRAALLQPDGPLDYIARQLARKPSREFRERMADELCKPANRELVLDENYNLEDFLKYRACKSEVIAEMYALYVEKVQITKETGKAPTYNELLSRYSNRRKSLTGMEELFNVLEKQAFEPFKVGVVEPPVKLRDHRKADGGDNKTDAPGGTKPTLPPAPDTTSGGSLSAPVLPTDGAPKTGSDANQKPPTDAQPQPSTTTNTHPLPPRPETNPDVARLWALHNEYQKLEGKIADKKVELELARKNEKPPAVPKPGDPPTNAKGLTPQEEYLNSPEHAKIVKIEEDLLELTDQKKALTAAMYHGHGIMLPGKYMVKAANGEVCVIIPYDAINEKAVKLSHVYEILDELIDIKPNQRDTLPAEILIQKWDEVGKPSEFGAYNHELALMRLTILDARRMQETPLRVTIGHETGHAYQCRIITRADEKIIKKIDDKYAETFEQVVQAIAKSERNTSAENIAEIRAELLNRDTDYTPDKVGKHAARYCASYNEVIAEMHMLYREQQRASANGEQLSYGELLTRFSPRRAPILNMHEGMFNLLKTDVFPKLPIATPRVRIGTKPENSGAKLQGGTTSPPPPRP